MEKKITNVSAMEFVIENFGENMPEDVFAKITAIKDSFVKKSENRKPTKTQEENEKLKIVVLEALTEEGVSVTNLIKNTPALEGLSVPKVSAILSKLKDEKKVSKVMDKKTPLYSRA